MDFSLTHEQEQYRQGIRGICAKFPDSYWRGIDAEKRYPEEFVRALTTHGVRARVRELQERGGVNPAFQEDRRTAPRPE